MASGLRLWATLAATLVCSIALTVTDTYAQNLSSPNVSNPDVSTTPQIHKDFPFQHMWDDALRASQRTRKPVLAFDLDLVDSSSIIVANNLLHSKVLREFILRNFEPALNDFAIDPPLSIGLDSLRNLGRRLSGLEKKYRIGIRPTLIVLNPDSTERERILAPQSLSPKELEERLTEILQNRNTLRAVQDTFWRDTTSEHRRMDLVRRFEEHGLYDSVMYHLAVLRLNKKDSMLARTAAIRYAQLKLEVEGETGPEREFIATLGKSKEDSALHYGALQQLLDYFQRRKRADSVSAMFEEIMHFTGQRTPDILNDYAWHLANYTKDHTKALALAEEANKKRPNDPYILDTKAFILGLMGKFEEAISTEERAVRLAKASDRKQFESAVTSLKEQQKDAKKSDKK